MARKPRTPQDRREGAGQSRHRAPESSDSDTDRRGDRPRPDVPEGWRRVMSNYYEYPEELEELNSRKRRRAKKNWRRDVHAQRLALVAQPRHALGVVVATPV